MLEYGNVKCRLLLLKILELALNRDFGIIHLYVASEFRVQISTEMMTFNVVLYKAGQNNAEDTPCNCPHL